MGKITIVYAVLISIIVGLCGYSLGFNAHHTPKYIYVKYETIQKNLIKDLKAVGVELNQQQESELFKKLKEKK